MRSRFCPGFAVLCFWILLPTVAAAGPGDPRAVIPLAIIDGDTVTTRDLDLELALMRKQRGGAEAVLAPAQDVLRRLVQNRLVVHEGYRMGLDEQFAVKNQVTEAIRSQCTEVLLDSVVASVPQIMADLTESRRQAVAGYVENLKRRYVASLDSTLLHSLDYASADPQVQERLRESDAVLASIPPGEMRVKGLSRQIRFIEFHGLVGRDDAVERRDSIFEEWLVESLLRYQAKIERIAERPTIRRFEAQLERELMFEETLKILLAVEFTPTERDVEVYYQAHLAAFTPQPRVKLESARTTTEAGARKVCASVRQGAKLSWLRKTSPDIVAGPPPVPEQFVEPDRINLAAANIVVGHVLEPVEVPGGWLVAAVVEVEPVSAQALADCREQVVQMMRGEHTGAEMATVLSRLEKASQVRVLPGAEAQVARMIEESRRDGSGQVTP
jgi:hypothetical protein